MKSFTQTQLVESDIESNSDKERPATQSDDSDDSDDSDESDESDESDGDDNDIVKNDNKTIKLKEEQKEEEQHNKTIKSKEEQKEEEQHNKDEPTKKIIEKTVVIIDLTKDSKDNKRKGSQLEKPVKTTKKVHFDKKKKA